MIYEVKQDVTIRKGKTPAIVEYTDPKTKKFITNAVGMLEAGTQNIKVYSTFVDTKNVQWARISEPDASGSSQWACIKNINTTFMILSSGEEQSPDTLSDRLSRLETWARVQGYKG